MAGICGANMLRQSFRDIVTNGLVLHFDSFYPDKYVNGTSKLEALVSPSNQPMNMIDGYTWLAATSIPATPNGILQTSAGPEYSNIAIACSIIDSTDFYANWPSGTQSVWVRLSNVAQGQAASIGFRKMVHNNWDVGGQYNFFINGNGTNGSNPVISANSVTSAGSVFQYNKWQNVGCTWTGGNGGTTIIYYNGVAIASGTSSWPAMQQSGHPLLAFYRTYSSLAEHPITKLYNRALSSDEMLQNFNVLRKRFKI